MDASNLLIDIKVVLRSTVKTHAIYKLTCNYFLNINILVLNTKALPFVI